jgi:hypothetical protein
MLAPTMIKRAAPVEAKPRGRGQGRPSDAVKRTVTVIEQTGVGTTTLASVSKQSPLSAAASNSMSQQETPCSASARRAGPAA